MKNNICILILALLTFACSPKKEGNMIVNGQIKGLKKGTLYLQKIKDTTLTSVDSIHLFGDSQFTLSDQINSPELYYLTFKGNTTDKKILFFGEKGTINIKDNLKQFGINPIITGSNNQEILDKFNSYSTKFQNQHLDFIKKDFDARKNNNPAEISKLEDDYQKMLRRKILFTTNYTISHPDAEASAYIALTLNNASIKIMDTINNSLTPKVKNSIYGKQLQEHIQNLKAKYNQ